MRRALAARLMRAEVSKRDLGGAELRHPLILMPQAIDFIGRSRERAVFNTPSRHLRVLSPHGTDCNPSKSLMILPEK